jgi:hypothetical protein
MLNRLQWFDDHFIERFGSLEGGSITVSDISGIDCRVKSTGRIFEKCPMQFFIWFKNCLRKYFSTSWVSEILTVAV